MEATTMKWSFNPWFGLLSCSMLGIAVACTTTSGQAPQTKAPGPVASVVPSLAPKPTTSSSSQPAVIAEPIGKIAAPIQAIDHPQLAAFFTELHALESKQRKQHVRIMWLGDSHAHAGFWTGQLQSLLQKRFGAGGPGFLYAGYPRYRHGGLKIKLHGKWKLLPKNPAVGTRVRDGQFGLGGALTKAHNQLASAQFDLSDLDTSVAKTLDVCYLWKQPGEQWDVSTTGLPVTKLVINAEHPVDRIHHHTQVFPAGGPLGIKIEAHGGQPHLCGLIVEYDAENHPGVVLDNLGINGARLRTVLAWDKERWLAEVKRRNPSLVILQYGTNEASDPVGHGERIRKQLHEVVTNLRSQNSHLSCVVLAPTDREDVPKRTAQARDALAAQAAADGCWFWDTIRHMGGKGSISSWKTSSPPKAIKDGIHLTPLGYQQLGQQLFNDLMNDYKSAVERSKRP
jgi:lysophospholipase L1-like esterase